MCDRFLLLSSEDSSSPVPRVEVSMNRPNETSSASIVSNSALQPMANYSANTIEPSPSISDHYGSHQNSEM